MADIKFALSVRSTGGAFEANGNVASVVDRDGAYAEYDVATTRARFGAKGSAGSSRSVSIRTLNAGAVVDALIAAANGDLTAIGALVAATSITSTGGNFVLGTNTGGILFKSTSGTNAQITEDGNNNLWFKLASAAATGLRITDSSNNGILTYTPGSVMDFPLGGEFRISGNRLLNSRKTGWAVATGTKTRTTFVTDTVTLPELAARVGALVDDLHQTAGHGLIGT